MTNKELAATIKGIYSAKLLRVAGSEWLMNECARLADQRQIDYSIYTACYGILWAVKTGRLSGTICIQIRDMAAKDTFKLIADTAAACPTIGDVPSFLVRTLTN